MQKTDEKVGTESDFRPFFFGSAYREALFGPGGAQAARFVAVLGEEGRGGRFFEHRAAAKPGAQAFS
ncbi:hypothetical protein [Ralstonia sp.]|uniref:hypothetical protein n=1 Tax=Ralstonia sp. TaxID=54061 RepID=UPI0031CF1DC2